MSPVYTIPITTVATAYTFMQALVANGHMWHPEERAINCDIEPKLAKVLQRRMDECWEILEDPCEMALDLLEAQRCECS